MACLPRQRGGSTSCTCFPSPSASLLGPPLLVGAPSPLTRDPAPPRPTKRRSYALPGHRLGALVASHSLLTQVSKLLDCLQICPARPAQRALAWAVDGTRPWREGTRRELEARQRVFREGVEGVEGWEVVTGGAYFAYVRRPLSRSSPPPYCPRPSHPPPLHRTAPQRPGPTNSRARTAKKQVKHPFGSSPSQLVAARLASLAGVVVLPGSFFSPRLPGDDAAQDDRYLRFCA